MPPATVAVVTAGVTEDEAPEEGRVTVVGMATEDPAVPHGAMVVVAHESFSKFLMRPNSLWSIERFQCALIATHSARYVHW